MQTKTMTLLAAVILVIVVAIYLSQLNYKYSCESDAKCYPCTRWMNCVSEDFYLRNTEKCRSGGEENLSRIVCGCKEGMCRTIEIKPLFLMIW